MGLQWVGHNWAAEHKVYIDMQEGVIIGIGSCNYGGWNMAWHAVCNLEKQKCQWYNSVWVWRSKNQGAKDVNPNLRTGEEIRIHISSSELRGKGWLPLSSPFIIFRPSTDWMMPLTLGRAICLTKFMDSSEDNFRDISGSNVWSGHSAARLVPQKVKHHVFCIHKVPNSVLVVQAPCSEVEIPDLKSLDSRPRWPGSIMVG